MNRLVVVALVAVALAGCAQTHLGQPQPTSPFPPVGLEPLPSIHDTINGGLKPSRPGRADGPQLAANPPASETQVASASDRQVPGRPAPYADRQPPTGRPRAVAAAEAAAVNPEDVGAAREVASSAMPEPAPAVAEATPAEGEAASASAVADAKPTSPEPLPGPQPAEPEPAPAAVVENSAAPQPAESAAVAEAGAAPSTEVKPTETASMSKDDAPPSTEAQPAADVATASAPATSPTIPLEVQPPAIATEQPAPAPASPAQAQAEPALGTKPDTLLPLESLPPPQPSEPPAAVKTEEPAPAPPPSITPAPLPSNAPAPIEQPAAVADPVPAPSPPAPTEPRPDPTAGKAAGTGPGVKPVVIVGPEPAPPAGSLPTAKVLTPGRASVALGSGTPPPQSAGPVPSDIGQPPSAQLPFEPPPLPAEPAAGLPPLPPDSPEGAGSSPRGAQPVAAVSTELPPLPDSATPAPGSALPPLPGEPPSSGIPASTNSADSLPPLPAGAADTPSPGSATAASPGPGESLPPLPAGGADTPTPGPDPGLPPLPPGAANTQAPPPGEISLSSLDRPAPAAGGSGSPVPVVPAPVPATHVDPEVRRTSAQTDARAEIKPRTADEYTEIAARVGDDVITLQELRKAYQEWVRGHVPAGQQLTTEDKNQVVRLVLNNLIDRTLALQEAHREIKNAKQWDHFKEFAVQAWNEEELQPLLRKYGVKNEYELKQKLSERGKSLEEMREDYKQTKMAREFVMMKVKPKLNVGLPEMRDYYNEHLSDFNRPATITWREVVVEVGKYPDRATARHKADALLARLRNGEEFAKLAKSDSDGPTAREGGLWKTTPGSYAIPAVNDGLASIPLRQVSSVLEGPTSFHIIRVEERREAGPARFDEVQDEVHEILTERVFQHEMKAFVDHLRERTLITTKLDEAEAH